MENEIEYEGKRYELGTIYIEGRMKSHPSDGWNVYIYVHLFENPEKSEYVRYLKFSAEWSTNKYTFYSNSYKEGVTHYSESFLHSEKDYDKAVKTLKASIKLIKKNIIECLNEFKKLKSMEINCVDTIDTADFL